MDVTSDANNFKNAQKAFENVIEIYEKNEAEIERTKLVEAYLNLAYSLQGQGELMSSIGYFDKGIELCQDQPKAQHLLGEAYLNYGDVLHMNQKNVEAEAMVRKAMPILEKKYGVKSEYYGAASSNLAMYICLQADGREQEALEHSKRALQIFTSHFGKTGEQTVYALTNTLRILKELNDEKGFEELRKKYNEVDVDVDSKPPSEETLTQMYNEFLETPHKKSFDPPGFIRNEKMNKEQLSHFLDMWKGQGLPTDFNFMDTVAKEFMLMDQQGPLYEEKSEEYIKNLALEQNKDQFDEETYNLLRQKIEEQKESTN